MCDSDGEEPVEVVTGSQIQLIGAMERVETWEDGRSEGEEEGICIVISDTEEEGKGEEVISDIEEERSNDTCSEEGECICIPISEPNPTPCTVRNSFRT